MKKKKIKLSRENLQEFYDKYRDKYVLIPEGIEIKGWESAYSSNSGRDYKKFISDYKVSGKVDKIDKNNNLHLEDGYVDGVTIYLNKPIEVTVDDFEAKPKMHYADMDEAFKDLVPSSGSAYCKAGEIVRAFCNLSYSFYNNGDKVGCDCGGNTRQYSAGYILGQLVDDRVFQERLDKLYGTYRDDYYERGLDKMEQILLDYINDNEELYDIDDFEPVDLSGAQWY